MQTRPTVFISLPSFLLPASFSSFSSGSSPLEGIIVPFEKESELLFGATPSYLFGTRKGTG